MPLQPRCGSWPGHGAGNSSEEERETKTADPALL
jgi:hypothetical protein